ncbi:ABC transporter permease [Companilactobacillus sp. HBUAS59544]|uniref:ABC transporter permease n=1 Tax=Companilactobacillus sp. HBUAS59544 TaxID=3109363 RepID=UPI002FF15A74
MRTWMIAKRILIELLRDKRTLVLIFVAPLLILFLMKLVFSVNSQTDVTIGVVGVKSSLVEKLDSKHMEVVNYATKKHAIKELNQKLDAVIVSENDDLDVTYSNTDASKTKFIKQRLQMALMSTRLSQLTSSVKKFYNVPDKKFKITNHYQYGNKDTNFFDKIVPILMGFFVFFFVFLISGMSLLNERTSGTLNRLLATPVRRSEIVFGYMLSYGLVAIVQTLIIVFFTIWALKVEVIGNLFYVILINFVLALVAMAFGILMSTFAKSEFQMMQFIPLIIVPQIFFSGMIPLETMASGVQVISYFLPMKYAGDALTQVVMSGANFKSISQSLLMLLVFLVVLTMLNILGLKKYRKV